MTFEFRPARAEEAAFHALVYTAAGPDEPITAAAVLEAWSAAPASAERYTILEAGTPVGVAGIAHPEWEDGQPRVVRLEADVLPDWRSHLNLRLAFDFIEARAEAAGAEHLVTHARESDELLILHLRRRGYGGKHVFQWREASLAGREDELSAAAAAAAAALAGHRLELLGSAPPDLAAGYPGARPDLSWVALGPGGELAGAAYVTAPEGANAWVEVVAEAAATAPVLSALELHALSSAAAAGLPRIRSEGASEDEWRPVPGMIEFQVEVEERIKRRANPRL